VPVTGSQGHRVPLHGGPDVGLQAVVGHEIDRGAEDVLQLVLESGQPDDAQPAVEVYEKVDVAVGPVFPARGAAEQSQVADAVPGRRLTQPLLVAADELRPRRGRKLPYLDLTRLDVIPAAAVRSGSPAEVAADRTCRQQRQ